MPSLTVHYDGWVQLPERMRKALRFDTGARLEAELIEGGILLRAAGTVGREKTKEQPAAEEVSAEASGGMAPTGDVPALPEQEDAFGSAEPTPTRPKPRGRRKAPSA